MSAAPARASPGRFLGLDTLRGFAVLRIVLYHYTTRFYELHGSEGAGGYQVTRTEFSVPMFFVISGFVIPLTLSKCRSVEDFAFLRASRLYPTFWTCLAITSLAMAVFGLPGHELTLGAVLVNLSMVPHFLGAVPVDGAYWTLEVEAAFYVLMGALFARRQLDKAPLVLMALALIHALSRDPIIQDSNFLTYAHLFAIGLLLFEVHHRRRPWHLAAFAAIWLIAYVDRGPSYLVWIALFFGLSALSVFRDPKIFHIRPLLWFGSLSYPLYLLHPNLGYLILGAARSAGLPPALGIALTLAVVVSLAAVVHRFVEQPATDWARQRWRERQRVSPAIVSTAAQ